MGIASRGCLEEVGLITRGFRRLSLLAPSRFWYVHVVVQDEELLAIVLHDVLAQVVYEVSDCHGAAMAVAGGNRQLVVALVREEHLQPAPETSCQLSIHLHLIYCVSSKKKIYIYIY